MNTKKQRKILQIITKSNWGGAQKYVYELSAELNTKGEDVVVAHGGNGLMAEKLFRTGVRTIEIKKLGRNISPVRDFLVLYELIKIIKKEKPTTIHLHSSKMGFLGTIAGRLCHVHKIVFSIHGLAFNENRNWVVKFAIKKIYWWIVFMSHKSIAVSNGLKKQLLDDKLFGFWFRLLSKKIIVIQNKIKPIDFYSREDSRNKIGAEIKLDMTNREIVGTVAELHHIKGLNYLITAVKQIHESKPDMTFIIFGEGDERINLEKQIQENNLEKVIFLLGFKSDATKYMSGLDLFVLPSISEGLALVLLEARQAKLPIIASNVGGISEALENYNNYKLVSPHDSSELSKVIMNFKNTSETFTITNEGNNSYSQMYSSVVEIYA
jgi:glycosyltransferase involved in cell wall biosynthesis